MPPRAPRCPECGALLRQVLRGLVLLVFDLCPVHRGKVRVGAGQRHSAEEWEDGSHGVHYRCSKCGADVSDEIKE